MAQRNINYLVDGMLLAVVVVTRDYRVLRTFSRSGLLDIDAIYAVGSRTFPFPFRTRILTESGEHLLVWHSGPMLHRNKDQRRFYEKINK